MTKSVTAYIGLGSNLADRKDSINRAFRMLADTADIESCRLSDIIETNPLDGMDQPKYLNAVAEIKTTLSAEDLHKRTNEIELLLGRTKKQKWAPRVIDLDILLFGQDVINTPDLTVPHPQMHLRRFVLEGLYRLNADTLHPVIKEPVSDLAARLNGCDFVLDNNLPKLVSIAGVIGVGKTTLTEKISALLKCKKVLEAYDTNPFMPKVYAGSKDMALDSQLYFLAGRIRQLSSGSLLPGQITVSDYVFDKELIYARRLLDKQQLTLYEQLYQPLAPAVTRPVLVIYLTDSPERCLQRIRQRNRPYEQKIEPEFLQALDSDYQRLFADWKSCPVICLSMSDFDCSRSADIERLVSQIKIYTAG